MSKPKKNINSTLTNTKLLVTGGVGLTHFQMRARLQ